MQFSLLQIRKQFGQQLLDAGQHLVDKGWVQRYSSKYLGNELSAEVKDLQGNRELVFINIRPQQPLIDAECSCEQDAGCPHVTAVLLTRHSGNKTASNETPASTVSLPPLQLAYILEALPASLRLELRLVRPKPGAPLFQSESYLIKPKHIHQPPGFINQQDRDCLRQLLGLSEQFTFHAKRELPILRQATILQDLVATGRCYWLDNAETALQWGHDIDAEAVWQLDQGGYQHLKLQVQDRQQLLLYPWQQALYFDPSTNCCGLANTQLASSALHEIRTSTALAPDQVDEFVHMHKHYPRLQLPQPATLAITEINSRPHAQLLCYSQRCTLIEAASYTRPVIVDAMRIQFDYASPAGSHCFSQDDLAQHYYRYYQGELFKIQRDLTQEQDLIDILQQYFCDTARLENVYSLDWSAYPKPQDLCPNGEAEWRQLSVTTLPALQKHNWQVQYRSGFRHQHSQVQGWYHRINKTAKDKIAVEVGIKIDGKEVNLLPELIKKIQQTDVNKLQAGSLFRLQLADERWVDLDTDQLQRIITTFIELQSAPRLNKNQQLVLEQSQLHRLAQLDQDNTLIDPDQLFSKAQQFRDIAKLKPVAPPTQLEAQLRPYQNLGLCWLDQLWQHQMAGILADDMGLGKTLQTLAHIANRHQAGELTRPVLVVAPTSVVGNWLQEAKRFTPHLSSVVIEGRDRHALLKQDIPAQIMITSYALILRDKEHWQNYQPSLLVLDEAQWIKNPRTQLAKALKGIPAAHKLCLTGTPLENHLGELWSLFEFLMPGFLGSEKYFLEQYRLPIERKHSALHQQALLQRIAPFVLRRNKKQVAPELPKKTEIIQKIALDTDQRKLYDSFRSLARKEVSQLIKQQTGKAHLSILDQLLRLRQLCCHPQLLGLKENSAKLKHLLEMLTELQASGRKVLLFSQFTSMLKIISTSLDKAGLSYLTLTGSTPNRQKLVNRFQLGEVDIFLISLKAGGIGLNLTAADTVIHYDPWWNPAVEQQATDRAYRIGQDKPVFVYKLIAQRTIEEQIVSLQQQKQGLINSVTDSEEISAKHIKLSSTELYALIEEDM